MTVRRLSLLLSLALGCRPDPMLDVVFTAPQGTSPVVTVVDPNGGETTVREPQGLRLLEGTYSVRAPAVYAEGSVVSTVYDALAPASITVERAHRARLEVVYARRPGSGALWLLDHSASTLSGLSDAQLAAPVQPTPDIVLGFQSDVQTYGLAFDGAGHLWTSLSNQPARIIRLAPTDLAESGAAVERASIASAGIPKDLAFDRQGNLWIADQWTERIARYPAASLTGEGRLSAVPDVSFTASVFDSFGGIAFDASGNLWVGTDLPRSAVVPSRIAVVARFAAARLAAKPFEVELVEDASLRLWDALGEPIGLAFDASGNLWIVTNRASLLRYDAISLASADSSTIPARVISLAGGPVAWPGALAFDNAGGLWIASHGTGQLVRFGPAQLPGTGNAVITPEMVLSVSSSGRYNAMAFSPPPSGVPIPR